MPSASASSVSAAPTMTFQMVSIEVVATVTPRGMPCSLPSTARPAKWPTLPGRYLPICETATICQTCSSETCTSWSLSNRRQLRAMVRVFNAVTRIDSTSVRTIAKDQSIGGMSARCRLSCRPK
ncbi:hypothetical protein D9M68_789970 [compost metagenome]